MKNFFILLLFVAMLQVGFAKKVTVLPDIMNPENFIVDGDKFFISQEANIFIYNLSDFKLLKKIGKKGEGPQEFKINPQAGGMIMDIQPDYIYVSTLNKISYFSRDGEFKKEVRNPALTTFFTPLGNKHVGIGFAREGKIILTTVNLYDAALKKVKELHRQEHFLQTGKFTVFGQLPLTKTFKDKIIVAGEKGIVIFNDKGQTEVAALQPFDKLKIEDDHKEKARHFYKTDPRIKHLWGYFKNIMTFPTYFPYFQLFLVTDGKIYVQTYKRKDNKSELVILDLKGKPVKKTFLPLVDKNMFEPYLYSIYNGKVYQLIENIDEEEYELHIFPIE